MTDATPAASKSYIPLNLGLMANPVNWAIVVLMVVIAGMGVSLVFSAPKQDKKL